MIREAIATLSSGRSLSFETAMSVMDEVMSDLATPAQFGAFVMALRMNGETSEEIAGMARVMRDKALRVEVSGPLVDTCGTGGDARGTFNISTAVAFVVAGVGLKVAKHGNRAISGACGSADVLEEIGIKIELGPKAVARCIEELGIGFMFAPIFHPAMKYASPLRREIGVRTVFNLLGPLTNPATPQFQVIGVFDPGYGERMAQVMGHLGTSRALIVHGAGGVDELTLAGENQIWELRDGHVSRSTLNPGDVDLPTSPLTSIAGGDQVTNSYILQRILSGDVGPCRDVVLLNAAAALTVSGIAPTFSEGIQEAAQAIDSGAALDKLFSLRTLTQSLDLSNSS